MLPYWCFHIPHTRTPLGEGTEIAGTDAYRIPFGLYLRLALENQALLENSVDGLVVTDIEETILYANRAAEKRLSVNAVPAYTELSDPG